MATLQDSLANPAVLVPGTNITIDQPAPGDPVTISASSGGGSAAVHAQYTSSFTGNTTSALGTPAVDAARSTSTSFLTPGANASFTVAASGIYLAHVTFALPGTTWSGNPRIFGQIIANSAEVARASLLTTSNEDAFAVSAPGFYLAAGEVFSFGFYRSSGSATVNARYFVTKVG